MKMTATVYGKNKRVLAKYSFEAQGFNDAMRKTIAMNDISDIDFLEIVSIDIERA